MSGIEKSASVLIIGGGASGVAAAAAIRQTYPHIAITIVEKRERVGLGVAYATEMEHHLLNVPAIKMGVYEESHEHFLQWLQRNGEPYASSDFVPRHVYGRYLQDVLQNDVLSKKPTTVLQSDVVSLERRPNGFRAHTGAGEVIEATFVILATGHTPLQVPVRTIEGVIDSRLVLNPWASEGYKDLSLVKEVAILGTGLTAMDVVGALDGLKYRGAITLFSRRGLLPYPSVSGGSVSEYTLDKEILSLPLRALTQRVRAELHAQVKKGRDWHVVVDALRPHTPQLWHRLSEFERGQFLRHLRSYWEVARHRMPDHMFRRVKEIEAEGRLSICRGRVEELDFSSDAALVGLRYRSRGMSKSAQFEKIFNCAGSSALQLKNLPPLLQSLHTHNAVQFDRFGLGMYTASSGELLDKDNGIVRGCYLIGPARRASEWESTAMREIRLQAHLIARGIAVS